jgi:ParB-like chromosome segregation protein Spo0J
MAVQNKIEYSELKDLNLDASNPRLGRENTAKQWSQGEVLEAMKDWTLDELALSFLESGFWPQEALLAVEELLNGQKSLVVVEGTRRLAALKLLKLAFDGKPESKKWRDLIAHRKPPPNLFSEIPYIRVGNRKDVVAFLGFRHVTGIKEWNPAEKAEYIANLIEDHKMGYDEIRRKIGSKIDTVRRNYISYRLLLQMEGEEEIDLKRVEDKFSVLYLSLRTEGAQRYLQVDIEAEPGKAKKPVPQSRLEALAKFALWLFGDKGHDPIVKESRFVEHFGKVLLNKKAVEYLERTDRPSLDFAYRIAGGDEFETIEFLQKAADDTEQALSLVHHYKNSPNVQSAVKRLGIDVYQLMEIFPKTKQEIEKELA